ncbi:thiol peroxidase [Gemella cuniculi]|uniref:thiol peroxidase n=1 Tax=Gemella cuniculi TaxID=150240 RepID=UPI00041D2805|nr:thiol peroxidase [Gemella cuniculi]
MKKTITFKNTPVTIEDRINVGDVFPNFKAVNKDLTDFNLENYKGKTLVINAFPSVDTGICALQTIRFNQEMKNFSDVIVITVSKDLPFALGRFCADKEIKNAVTVSDYKYREFENNIGGLIVELGLLSRMVFIIDKDGIVRYKELCEEVGNEPNYENALEILKILE